MILVKVVDRNLLDRKPDMEIWSTEAQGLKTSEHVGSKKVPWLRS